MERKCCSFDEDVGKVREGIAQQLQGMEDKYEMVANQRNTSVKKIKPNKKNNKKY